MKKDQKGDLVEQLIFEAYKDKYIRCAEAFKQLIKAQYGIVVSSDLYRKIINYQVKKYGGTLSNQVQREYTKYFGQKESMQRYKQRKRNVIKQRENRRIERIEKEKFKKSIKGKEA